MKRSSLCLCVIGLAVVSWLAPLLTSANGGDQRVGDGYLVNLSRSPFTPIAGVKTALLASFVDLKTGKLIKDDILVSIRIGEGRGSKTFIHEKKDIPVQGGILEYSYTFQNPGMHEIFFDFTVVNDPEHRVHQLPDFLLDVQKPMVTSSTKQPLVLGGGILAGVIVGFLLGWASRKPHDECPESDLH